MRSLTSVRKTWELCFCHVSWVLQPDSILKDLWALQAGPGGWWPLPSQTVRDTLAETPPPRGAGALAPHRCANLTHLRSEGTGCWLPRMQKAPPCTTHLIVSYFVSASPPTNLSSSHRPSKISAFKKKKCTGKHIPKQPDEKNHVIKIRVVIVTMGVFQPLQFI